MNMDNIPDSNYIHIERWMYKLGLNFTEIAIYACIHGFCQDGISMFNGSKEYLQAWSGAGRSTVFNALKKMIDMKLIVKRFVAYKGKPYPVYYTVRSRQMYQEMARKNGDIRRQEKSKKDADVAKRNKGLDCCSDDFSDSPKFGQESDLREMPVQNSDSESPKSGRNNIANKNLEKAAEDVGRVRFISSKIRETLGCDPYPPEFKEKLGMLIEKNGFDDGQTEKYIRFVAEKARAKEPESLPALFKTLVLADDVAADFVMKTFTEKRTDTKRAFACPCCGETNDRNSFSCAKCEFTFSDAKNPLKVLQARQIFCLPKTEKERMDRELCSVFQRFDIRKFSDPRERIRQQIAMDDIYRKFGIAVSADEVLEQETAL